MPACTELVLRNPEDDLPRYATLFTSADSESCRILSIDAFQPRTVRLEAVYEVGRRVELDAAFARVFDGRCVAAPGGSFVTLDRVPSSAFAEVELLESP